MERRTNLAGGLSIADFIDHKSSNYNTMKQSSCKNNK